jgi:hypothetical protein
MGITFDFKKKKEEEREQYLFPVLTQIPRTDEKGSVAKFKLNKALIEALGSPKLVSVGQDEAGDIIIANTSDLQTPHQFHVNSDNTVNSKFLFERLAKRYSVKQSDLVQYNVRTYFDCDMQVAGICGWFDEDSMLTQVNDPSAFFDPLLVDETDDQSEYDLAVLDELSRDAYYQQEEIRKVIN